jgi:caffeoyl-CoA O-methyltransferase
VSIDPAVQRFAEEHTTPLPGPIASAARWTGTNLAANAQMMAGLPEAQLLTALVALCGATNVLEIGTFTGVGTMALAAGLRDGGQVTSIEIDPESAATARRHIDASPWADRINLRLGDATDTLGTLPGPFDLVWIDAAKSDYPAYWTALRPKLSPGGVVLADNMFLGGRVLDAAASDASVRGIRRFLSTVRADPEFDSVLLSVGDGVLLAWHRLGVLG